jgi:iron only hydrogenase large subunit-like protein
LRKVVSYLHTIGVHHVLDVSFARDISLMANAKEFHARFQPWQQAGAHDAQLATHRLPMLASACPGWVCYAEKTHPFTLDLMANTKSPQQVMGAIVKTYMAQQLQKQYARDDVIYTGVGQRTCTTSP